MKSILARNLNGWSSSSISPGNILKGVRTFDKHIRSHQDQRFSSMGNVRIALHVSVSNTASASHLHFPTDCLAFPSNLFPSLTHLSMPCFLGCHLTELMLVNNIEFLHTGKDYLAKEFFLKWLTLFLT